MLKNSIKYFIIRAFNGILGLATLFLLTRLMSAEQYGIYALGVAAIGMIASVLFQWIAVSVARFYGAHIDAPTKLIAEAIRLYAYVGIAGLSILGFYFTGVIVPAVEPTLVVAIGVGSISLGIHNLCLQIANAQGAPLRYGTLTISRGVFALCSAITLVQLDYGGVGAVFGFAVGSVLSVAIFQARYIGKIRHNNRKIRREIVKYGLPLTLTFFSTALLDVSDRLMISWWFGIAAVAGYAAAYDLTQQIVGALMNILLLASYPRVVDAWEKGGAPAARLAMVPLSQAMLLAAPFLAGIFIGGATEISALAFGEALRKDASAIIPWIAFAIAVGCFKTYYYDIAFQLSKVTNIQFRITALMALANICMNFYLMPRFGVIGAAAATATAFTIGGFLSWLFGRRLGIYAISKTDISNMIVVLLTVVFAMRIMPDYNLGVILNAIVSIAVGVMAYIGAIMITDLAKTRTTLIFWIKTTVIKK